MLSRNLSIILGFTFVLLKINNVTVADTLKSHFSKDPKIINGTDANINATSHQVSIRSRQDDPFGAGHHCGGSLISENVVLTAAHCFLDSTGLGFFLPAEDFIVVMGNLNRSELTSNSLIYNITKIITPANHFNTTTLVDDIALVILKGTVPAKHPTVHPIILNEGSIADQTTCHATGWGINENHVRSDILKTVDLPFLNVNDCRKATGFGPRLTEGMICAGWLEGERGPCTADSGGPLVCKGIQAGIVSWGSCYSVKLSPTVFTDVAHYKKWILHKVSHHNVTLPQFASVPGGVTSLSCSIFLICLMLTFNFFLFGKN